MEEKRAIFVLLTIKIVTNVTLLMQICEQLSHPLDKVCSHSYNVREYKPALKRGANHETTYDKSIKQLLPQNLGCV